jgi:hypothetical protein
LSPSSEATMSTRTSQRARGSRSIRYETRVPSTSPRFERITCVWAFAPSEESASMNWLCSSS